MKTIENPKKFAHDLCDWYRDNKRDLPFRKSKDPYKIFLSELMLQQTQIATMIPYYERFIERFPTIKALAEANQDEVLKYWEGLGYYSRARYIHESAQMIMNTYDGIFPEALNDIEALKGVGRYTSRAIHSIAYDEPSVAVDGNVMRVMSRVLLFDEDIRKTKNMRLIEDTLKNVIVHEKPADFTQALMELGALVCKKSPLCEACPLKHHCFAYKQNRQNDYPVVSKLKDKTTHTFSVMIVRKGNCYILNQRPPKGLLANMYEFPQYETSKNNALKQLVKDYELVLDSVDTLGTITHIFTHKIWTMHVYAVNAENVPDNQIYALNTFPHAVSKAHLKIIDLLKEKNLPL